MLKNISKEQKKFLLFLITVLLLCSAVGLIRVVLPTDSLEGIYWGSLQDFGTPKHPPFAGWLTYLTYKIFKCDYSIYFLCMLFISTGVFYIYKLAKYFLDEKRAILSAVIMFGCWAYTYVTSYYGFNPDVVLLCFLPLITYYAYKCLEENKIKDWILLGVIVGLAFLNKYQTALVIAPLFIWAVIFKPEIFKMKRFYASIILAFLIFLPHLLWLIKYDFFSVLYFEQELLPDGWWGHIVAPLQFFLFQILVVIGTLLIFVLLKIKQKSEFKLNINWDKETWFIILIAFTPLIIHMIMGCISGGMMRSRWGYEFLFMTGIMLFYFLPTKEISESDFNFVLKATYTVVIITSIVMLTLLGVEKNYRSRYPVELIHNDLLTFWQSKYNTPLKYIDGYIEWTLPLTIYSKSHPKCLLDMHGYKHIWLDEEDIKKSGYLILDRTEEAVKHRFATFHNNVKNASDTIEPVEYKFKLTNALNQEREYTVFYYIVPPNTDR